MYQPSTRHALEGNPFSRKRRDPACLCLGCSPPRSRSRSSRRSSPPTPWPGSSATPSRRPSVPAGRRSPLWWSAREPTAPTSPRSSTGTTRARGCCCWTRDASWSSRARSEPAPIGLNVPTPIAAGQRPGRRASSWSGVLPWRGNVDFPGLAYCTGGKSLYWGGWCPRLTAADLHAGRRRSRTISTPITWTSRARPASSRQQTSSSATCSTRCAPASPPPLHGVPDIERRIGIKRCRGRPARRAGRATPVSGLFSFDKFSALPLLIEAIREDVAGSGRHRRGPAALSRAPGPCDQSCTLPAGAVHTLEVDVGRAAQISARRTRLRRNPSGQRDRNARGSRCFHSPRH